MKREFLRAAAGVACLLSAGCFFSRGPLVEKRICEVGTPQTKIEGYAARFGAFRNLSGASQSFLFQQKDGRLYSSSRFRFPLMPEALLERYLREVLNSGTRADGTPLQLSAVIRRFVFDEGTQEAVFSVEYAVRGEHRSSVRGGEFRVPYRKGGEPDAMKKCLDLSLPMLRACIQTAEGGEGAGKK